MTFCKYVLGVGVNKLIGCKLHYKKYCYTNWRVEKGFWKRGWKGCIEKGVCNKMHPKLKWIYQQDQTLLSAIFSMAIWKGNALKTDKSNFANHKKRQRIYYTPIKEKLDEDIVITQSERFFVTFYYIV